ncbi:MAG: GMC family oxidoreductase N-terminal domain-containing protein, partial [Thermoplasmata archaeon]
GVTRFRRRRRRYRVVEEDMRVQADICIVGSGAGGGVLARELTRHPEIERVVLLERGGYYEGEDFNQRELDMLRFLWKGGALTFNQDFTILVGQGETLGGTTVINHAICIDTPPIVLQEWAEMGAGGWMTDRTAFTRALEEVKGEIHVSPVHEQQINRNNRILRRGAEELEIVPEGHGINPRNCFDCRECGFSHLGCHYDAKQSTLVTYIPEALDTGKCAIFCDAWAHRVRHEGGRATGVDAVLRTRRGEDRHRLRVDAKVVVVAAGAVNSTALLLRSKLPDPHRQLGQGLSLHPSPLVIAEFDDEVRAFEGIPMSYHVSEYSVLRGVPGILPEAPPVTSEGPGDQRGGFMLESVFPNLGQFAAFLPGMGAEHKALMGRLAHFAAAGILIRDTPKGVVKVNRSGDPVVEYALDEHDRRNLSNGMRTLAELYFEAGAQRVILTHRDRNIIEREAYLKNRDVIKTRIRPDNCGQQQLYLGSVHPQGGNRLGEDPARSVVDEHCFHHQVRNLAVCDASVFPTATGVNPMLTIMGMAKRTAEYIQVHWNELASGG